MPRRPILDRELLSCRSDDGDLVICSPDGLQYGTSMEVNLERVPIAAVRAAVDRYSARKTTVPGSYAYRHFIETGHVLKFGCCLGTER